MRTRLAERRGEENSQRDEEVKTRRERLASYQAGIGAKLRRDLVK